MKIRLSEMNACSTQRFVEICGPFFEHSPWIAERSAAARPFANCDALHRSLVATVASASTDEQLALIRVHPDLVGAAARAGRCTAESTREQVAAGLGDVTDEEARRFDELNNAYREKFGFPFVICARENKKDAILATFPRRLANSPREERRTALDEIAKIARVRLFDAIEEG
jgi:OHCU decarboxylase